MEIRVSELRKDLKRAGSLEKAKLLQRFFKTGKGEYGEGDVFLGIVVPVIRKISKEYQELDLKDIEVLLNSIIHEERLTALFILVGKYKKEEAMRKEIFDFYLSNFNHINNWDLVDLSAPKIAGDYLYNYTRKDDAQKKKIFDFAHSDHLWKKRIAILSTFYFINQGDFDDSLKISEILLNDKHDLIHKAVGWMLREIGKRNLGVEENFLKKHYKQMPRTMLRYAIERFEEGKRKKYLNGEI